MALEGMGTGRAMALDMGALDMGAVDRGAVAASVGAVAGGSSDPATCAWCCWR